MANIERLRFAGNDAYMKENFNAAAECYRQALMFDRENVAILCNLEAVELKLGELANAERQASIDSIFFGGHSRGQALEGLGRSDEAYEAHESSVKHEPQACSHLCDYLLVQ